jgi:hypothetical protein
VYDKRTARKKRDWRELQLPPVFSRFDTKIRFFLVDKLRDIRTQFNAGSLIRRAGYPTDTGSRGKFWLGERGTALWAVSTQRAGD